LSAAWVIFNQSFQFPGITKAFLNQKIFKKDATVQAAQK